MILSAFALFVAGLASVQEVESPDRADVTARIDALQGQDGPEADAQLALLRDALGALDRVDELVESAAAFRSDVAAAPDRLPELQRELEELEAAGAPAIPVDATAEELESLLQEVRSRREQLEGSDVELERIAESRRTRAEVLPNQLANAKSELAEGLAALPNLDATERSSARGVALRAKIGALRAEVDAIGAEQQAIDALRDVLVARREVAEKRLSLARDEEARLNEALAARRKEATEATVAETRERVEEAALQVPELAAAVERVEELTALLTSDDSLTTRIGSARAELEETKSNAEEVERRYEVMRDRLEAGGLTKGLSTTLRRDDIWLPRERTLDALVRAREARRSEAELQALDLREERETLPKLDAELETIVSGMPGGSIDDAGRAAIRTALERRRELLDRAITDATELVDVTYALGEETDAYEGSVQQYREAIGETILWARSVGPNPFESFLRVPGDAVDAARELDLGEALRSTGEALRRRPGVPAALVALAVLLLALRPRGNRRRRELAERVGSYRTDQFVYTAEGLAMAVVGALPILLLLFAFSHAALRADDELARALGDAAREMVAPLWALLFARRIAAPDGIADAHFRWSEARVRAISSALRWFTPVAVLLGGLALVLEGLEKRNWNESIGRFAFIAMMIATSVFVSQFVRAFQDPASSGATRDDDGAPFWTRLLVALPIVLAVASLLGYSYTALRLEEQLRAGLFFAAGLLLIHSVLERWLFITRRRLAVERARQRVEARAEGGEPEDSAAFDEHKVDIPALDAQTRQLFRSLVTIAAVVGAYVLSASTMPALKGLDRVQLLPRPAILSSVESSSSTSMAVVETKADDAAGGGESIAPPGTPQLSSDGLAEGLGLPAVLTLSDLLLAIIFGLIAFAAARNVPALLELALLRHLPMDAGARYATTTILRYAIVIVGISVVTGTLGLGWRQVQWLAAALTFGLAFGLQEIFANFVSGLIILIERPVRVGDIVHVGGTDGRITRLRMRATTIQDWDRREYLIPNKEFITSTVINWTLTDTVCRVKIAVGIAYGSDTRKAKSLLVDVARRSPHVLDEPRAYAIFKRFGDSTLDLELRAYTASMDHWPEVIDALHTSIDDAFRKEGIEIAFPQRDLHVRSVDPDVALRMSDGRRPGDPPAPGA